VISSEGVTAAVNRVFDRLAERRRLGTFEPISATKLQQAEGFVKPPVMNLSILPPFPNRGGSQLQLLDRLREERRHRTVALLYPVSTVWRLEVSAGDRRWILKGPESNASDTSLTEAVGWARRTLGTATIHIENLAGLPLNQIPALANDGPLIISVHDFTGYCRRPHLMEQPQSVFCDYSSDTERCRSCLARDWQLPPNAVEIHRDRARKSLTAATHLVFPSRFLKDRYLELFSDLELETRSRVIEPATKIHLPSMIRRPHPPHVAFVGGIKGHKGGDLVAQTAERLREHHEDLLLTSYGDGDRDLIRRIRRTARVRVHGFYRGGELPRLLVRDEVDVAIMPSIWPESYGLVVDECLHARVPVVAFDLGAIGPRLRRLGVGRVIDIDQGAMGLSTGAAGLLTETTGIDDAVLDTLPTPQRVAKKYIRLYLDLEGQ
jgi:glycosyltransferase involved in cell wall biosynthesis